MTFIFPGCSQLICSVAAKPCSDARVYNKEHCIPMTRQSEAEIQQIIHKISDYADDLALEHEFFDIRLMSFAIERHTPDETEDKDVEIQVTINDCTETFENGPNSETSQGNLDTNNASQGNLDTGDAIPDSPLVQPEVKRLDLDENGQELLTLLQKKRGKKRPVVVYIQSGKEHFFLRR